MLNAQTGGVEGTRLGKPYQRPTLHGIARGDGAREYIISGGLLAESFAPYRATVRIERYRPSGRL